MLHVSHDSVIFIVELAWLYVRNLPVWIHPVDGEASLEKILLQQKLLELWHDQHLVDLQTLDQNFTNDWIVKI